MQNRYAGDIGDYAKLALLRAISPGLALGIAWYLYPDESHNGDGRHTSYLDQPNRWRQLDPELFDALSSTVRELRSVNALQAACFPNGTTFASEPILTGGLPASQRSDAREAWFGRTSATLENCELIFADPDNGLIDNSSDRRRDRKFGKQMPLSEALAISSGRQAVIYHHNTRFPGGHDLEVSTWQERLGPQTMAVRAHAFSCRTFFILNPTGRTRERAIEFAKRWQGHKVRLVASL